jgi:hypothetical protein
VRAFARGDGDAGERVARHGREIEPLTLDEARRVIAKEHGNRTWNELSIIVESRLRFAPDHEERFGALLAAFESARAAWGERGEARLDTGLRYGGARPLVIHARRSPGHYSFSDEAGAVDAAGRPRRWLDVAREVVDADAMNMNLRGVVSMGATDRRDTAWLHSIAARMADTSLAVYQALLELEAADEEPLRPSSGRRVRTSGPTRARTPRRGRAG